MANEDKNILSGIIGAVGSVLGGNKDEDANEEQAGAQADTTAVATAENEQPVATPAGGAAAGPQLAEYLRRRRTEVGRVVSNKMQQTVVVSVNRSKPHPLYKKVMRRSAKFMAHDEMGAGMGDTVRIIESRPMSKRKRWQVVEIIRRAEQV